MKISLLSKREDFQRIFSDSLMDFLDAYFGPGVKAVQPKSGGLSFRQNAELNVIYPAGMKAERLASLTSEFRYSDRPLRRWLQAIYCSLAVRMPFAHWVSPVAFDLIDAPVGIQSWVFLPGNHTIRAIDVECGISLVFRKRGFPEAFFLRDAKVRLIHDFLPAPKVTKLDEYGGWYSEEYVRGLPLNRIGDKTQADAALSQAVLALGKLRSATIREASLHEYALGIAAEIRNLCAQLKAGLGDVIPSIELVTKYAENIVENTQPHQVFLCECHGDFQPANILVCGEQVWLIDWEYSGTRSAFYDFMVYTARSRFHNCLGDRLRAIHSRLQSDGGMTTWDFFQEGEPDALLALFILEDISLKLAEVAAPGIADKQSGLFPWIAEVLPLLSEMNRCCEETEIG